MYQSLISEGVLGVDDVASHILKFNWAAAQEYYSVSAFVIANEQDLDPELKVPVTVTIELDTTVAESASETIDRRTMIFIFILIRFL